MKSDIIKAVQLYSKACNNGILEACNNLGNFYEDGDGVEQSYEKAIELYLKACNGGLKVGCLNYNRLKSFR